MSWHSLMELKFLTKERPSTRLTSFSVDDRDLSQTFSSNYSFELEVNGANVNQKFPIESDENMLATQRFEALPFRIGHRNQTSS